MTRLERILLHIMSVAERGLGRTEIVKLCYLVDVESMRLTGQTMIGTQFVRYRYGPYSAGVVSSLENLVSSDLVVSAGGWYFSRSAAPKTDGELTSEQLNTIEAVVKRYRSLRLGRLKQVAYETPPMKLIIGEEDRLGIRLDGRPLDMSTVVADRKKRPLSAVVAARSKVDYSSHGTVEKAAADDLELLRETEPFRRRALECLSETRCGPTGGRHGSTNKERST